MQDKYQPRVCVSIPVYNGERFLQEAIASVLRQDYSNLKLVVVDNASTDGTRELLEAVEDERFTALHFEEHVPVAENWERSLRHADGELVLLLSADNVLLPNALSRLAEAMCPPENGFAYGQSGTLNESVELQAFSTTLQRPRVGVITDVEGDILRRGFTIAIDGVMFRRSLASLRMSSASGHACDLDLFLRLGKESVRGFGIPQDVVLRRKHDGALSSNRSLTWVATLDTLLNHAVESDRPNLYRRRIRNVLLWAVVDAMNRNQRTEARRLVETYAGVLYAPARLLISGLLRMALFGRIISRVRMLRVGLGKALNDS